MAIASENKFPKVIYAISTGVAAASTGHYKSWMSTAGKLTVTSSSGGETIVGPVTATATPVPTWVQKLDTDASATSLDEFDDDGGAGTPPGWTLLTLTGGQTLTEGRDLLSIKPTSAILLADCNCILIANAISVGQAVEVFVKGWIIDDVEQVLFGPVISDGVTGAANAAQNMAQFATTNQAISVYPQDGTLTAMVTGGGLGLNTSKGGIYMRLEYDAANTFKPWISTDAVTWHAFPSMSQTMTPTHVGFGWNTNNTSCTYTSVAIDYIRIVTV